MEKNRTQDPAQVLLVDKPLEWTSFDVVKKLKYGLKIKKIGHAGTLDPLATGLLILCTGKKTKEIESFQAQEKEYTGTFILGQTTPSYDLETAVDSTHDITHITGEQVKAAAKTFEGWIDQVPPVFSAVKVQGKRAYESARAGKEIQLKAKKVEIKLFEITSVALPEVSFRVICSKGTYIRSLARDVGRELQVGAYLASLRRTRIGEFRVEDAKTLAEILQK